LAAARQSDKVARMPVSRLPRLCVLVILALCGLAPLAAPSAHSAQSGDIEIGHLWTYPTGANPAAKGDYGTQPIGAAVDVYGPFLNTGVVNDALVSVTSPVVSNVRLVMWVRGAQFVGALPLTLPPGKPVALTPQTQFLRFLGASKSFKAGDSFPLTLHFRNAPNVTIDVIVQSSPGGL
jgi:copper(I)-binding protein